MSLHVSASEGDLTAREGQLNVKRTFSESIETKVPDKPEKPPHIRKNGTAAKNNVTDEKPTNTNKKKRSSKNKAPLRKGKTHSNRRRSTPENLKQSKGPNQIMPKKYEATKEKSTRQVNSLRKDVKDSMLPAQATLPSKKIQSGVTQRETDRQKSSSKKDAQNVQQGDPNTTTNPKTLKEQKAENSELLDEVLNHRKPDATDAAISEVLPLPVDITDHKDAPNNDIASEKQQSLDKITVLERSGEQKQDPVSNQCNPSKEDNKLVTHKKQSPKKASVDITKCKVNSDIGLLNTEKKEFSVMDVADNEKTCPGNLEADGDFRYLPDRFRVHIKLLSNDDDASEALISARRVHRNVTVPEGQTSYTPNKVQCPLPPVQKQALVTLLKQIVRNCSKMLHMLCADEEIECGGPESFSNGWQRGKNKQADVQAIGQSLEKHVDESLDEGADHAWGQPGSSTKPCSLWPQHARYASGTQAPQTAGKEGNSDIVQDRPPRKHPTSFPAHATNPGKTSKLQPDRSPSENGESKHASTVNTGSHGHPSNGPARRVSFPTPENDNASFIEGASTTPNPVHTKEATIQVNFPAQGVGSLVQLFGGPASRLACEDESGHRGVGTAEIKHSPRKPTSGKHQPPARLSQKKPVATPSAASKFPSEPHRFAPTYKPKRQSRWMLEPPGRTSAVPGAFIGEENGSLPCQQGRQTKVRGLVQTFEAGLLGSKKKCAKWNQSKA